MELKDGLVRFANGCDKWCRDERRNELTKRHRVVERLTAARWTRAELSQRDNSHLGVSATSNHTLTGGYRWRSTPRLLSFILSRMS